MELGKTEGDEWRKGKVWAIRIRYGRDVPMVIAFERAFFT